MAKPYRAFECHPFVLAQQAVPGSYVSLETALSYHGWIPEAVQTTASIVPGTKSIAFEDSLFGRFSFHPIAIQEGRYLELVSRVSIGQQTMLVAWPIRALLDLVCLRKQEWQGIGWLEEGMRIEADSLHSVTAAQLSTLKLVHKHKRVHDFISKLEVALGMEPQHD